ncbi:hypothetical protein BJV82DRAFT_624818 [Fennellomyces sp. T-0311]|nr:hypothetical protein BJV82DRAFT_624818 [Fennellomyces sp. T-0311]
MPSDPQVVSLSARNTRFIAVVMVMCTCIYGSCIYRHSIVFMIIVMVNSVVRLLLTSLIKMMAQIKTRAIHRSVALTTKLRALGGTSCLCNSFSHRCCYVR